MLGEILENLQKVSEENCKTTLFNGIYKKIKTLRYLSRKTQIRGKSLRKFEYFIGNFNRKIEFIIVFGKVVAKPELS